MTQSPSDVEGSSAFGVPAAEGSRAGAGYVSAGADEDDAGAPAGQTSPGVSAPAASHERANEDIFATESRRAGLDVHEPDSCAMARSMASSMARSMASTTSNKGKRHSTSNSGKHHGKQRWHGKKHGKTKLAWQVAWQDQAGMARSMASRMARQSWHGKKHGNVHGKTKRDRKKHGKMHDKIGYGKNQGNKQEHAGMRRRQLLVVVIAKYMLQRQMSTSPLNHPSIRKLLSV